METLYSTGLRRAEALNLHLSDLDRHRRVVLVRLGKGNKDRFAPIGERALAWIDKYLNEVRPKSTRELTLVGGCAGQVTVRWILAAVRGYRWQQPGRSQGGFCSSPKACSSR